MTELASKGESFYLALIGDLRRSRAMPNRAEIQRRLEAGLERAGAELGPELAARFVVTLGDEFQGLLREPSAGVRALVSLEWALGDLPVRYALGWGALDTALRPEAIGMDGPCFHAAREALARGKRDERWATVQGFGDDDRILNGLLRLLGEVRAGWTRTQAATVAAMRRARTQKEVAAARGVRESTVSKALKGAMYEATIEAEDALRILLTRSGRREGESGASRADGRRP